ncbi:MAG: acyltransferase, partial [Rhizobiaceae bacterium]
MLGFGRDVPKPDASRGYAVLPGIQHLRAIAAFLVVFYHITASVAREGGQGVVFVLGAVGVDMFFVLSGFVLAMVVSRAEAVDGGFFMRRFARIAPLYYLMTLGLFVLALAAPGLLNTAHADTAHLLRSLLFLPTGDAAGGLQPILGLGWTLNYEMFFYALIAVTTRFFADNRLNAVILVLAAFVALGAVAPSSSVWVRFYTDPIILEFALGILVFRLVRLNRFTDRLALVSLVIGAAMLILGPLPESGMPRLLWWGLPAALVVAGSIRALEFDNAWLRALGDWSYSTYLLHVYVIQAAVKLILPAAGQDMPSVLATALVSLPLIVVGSAALYRLIEMPAMRALLDAGRE